MDLLLVEKSSDGGPEVDGPSAGVRAGGGGMDVRHPRRPFVVAARGRYRSAEKFRSTNGQICFIL